MRESQNEAKNVGFLFEKCWRAEGSCREIVSGASIARYGGECFKEGVGELLESTKYPDNDCTDGKSSLVVVGWVVGSCRDVIDIFYIIA